MATTFVKTWASSLNNAIPNTKSSGKYYLWALKAFLKGELGGMASGLWTCVGSSDGTNSSMAGTDYWGATYDETKINRDPTPTTSNGAYGAEKTNRNTIANLTSAPKITVGGISGYNCTFTLTGKAAWDTTPTVGDHCIVTGDLAAANRGYYQITNATATVLTCTKIAEAAGAFLTTAPTAEGPITLTAAGNFSCYRVDGGPVSAGQVAHSWICLKSPLQASGNYIYLIIDCIGPSDNYSSIYMCQTAPGGLGGTARLRPTAATSGANDETGWDAWGNDGNTQSLSYMSQTGADNDPNTTRRHIVQSTTGNQKLHGGLASDGSFWFAASTNTSGYFHSFFTLQEPAETWSGDTRKAVMFRSYASAGTGLCSIGGGGDFAPGAQYCSFKMRKYDGGALGNSSNGFPHFCYPYSVNDNTTGGIPGTVGVDAVGGGYTDYPIYIAMKLPYASKKGRMIDINWGNPYTVLPHGTCEPASSPYASTTIGYLWIPLGSNASVPSL